ncbi:MAG: ABC transporter permease subunit, partial [bacterium]
MCSALIHTRLKVDALLSGILVMTALYSINLMLMGRPNIPIPGDSGLLQLIQTTNRTHSAVLSASLLLMAVVILLYYVLRTDFGIAIRATGNSPTMARASGVAVDAMKITGLALSNALVAFSGSL